MKFAFIATERLERVVTSDRLAPARLPLVNKLAPLRAEMPSAVTMLRALQQSARTHPKIKLQIESLFAG